MLVRGASALARSLGVSPLVVGLTVVAFGTSAPELAINLTAALKGTGDISFGNIIGSNIANIGLIIGISALIKPLDIEGSVITREIPMMILATAAAMIMGFDQVLRSTTESYDRSDGIILLLLFCVFLYYTASEVIRKRTTDPFVEQMHQIAFPKKLKSISINIFFTAGGFITLIGGGKFTVDSAIKIAHAMNVPNVIIGLTIVAVGTSLPELVTSIIATWRGHKDLAVGNVIGSNIFNLLFITGLSASARPIPVPSSGHTDLFMMTLLSFLLLHLSISNRRKIVRSEGSFLLVLYFGYILWRALYS